jgi:putative copper resistance protein D
VTALLILARAVQFGSCLVLQSIFAVLLLVFVPVWTQRGANASPMAEKVCAQLRGFSAICFLLVFLSGFAWLWASIAGMSESPLLQALQPSLFWMVLSQTPPGHVWLVRAGIALIFVTGLFVPTSWHRSGNPLVRLIPGTLLATSLTASLAWLGHAGAGEGPNQNLQLAVDVLHLVAVGIWPAGLLPLAIFLRRSFAASNVDSLSDAWLAVRRFSTLSLVAVALLAASGLVNSYFLIDGFHALVTTNYGRTLLLKLALFGTMIGIGAWNLFLVKTPASAVVKSPVSDPQHVALRKVARNVAIEIVIGMLVVIVVAVLGILPPASHS